MPRPPAHPTHIWQSPMNRNIPTRCTVWLCVECWTRIAGRDRPYLICQEELRMWLQQVRNDSEHDDDSEDDREDDSEEDL